MNPADPTAHDPPDPEEEGRIGLFPSWRALYASVIVYTTALIILLYVFTVMLDFSAG